MAKKKSIIELTRCTIEDYRKKKKFPVAVLLENVRSMYNVGSIFRTADAFLVSKIYLCGISGCPPHPEIRKTALGSEDSVDWEYKKVAIETALKLKEEGWIICVLEQVHDSIPLQEFEPVENEKYLLVAGNEVNGVSQSLVDIADYVLEIPQEGVKHSLNVSVSVGIALFQLVKCRL